MQLEVAAHMAVYKRSTEEFIRDSDGRMDELGEDEYISFVFTIKNTDSQDLKMDSLYARIDGGESLRWKGGSLGVGQRMHCHIYASHMEKLAPGTHELSYYVNDISVYTGHLHLIRAWQKMMRYPTGEQIAAVSGRARSPYICYCPVFSDVRGITEYSVDFWVDDLDEGTYFSTMNWTMDTSSLKEKYPSLLNDYTEPGCCYCGFQCCKDGKMKVIMSVWDIFCETADGRQAVVRAKELFPGEAKSCKATLEGSFQQFLREYRWEAKHPYRMLMQQSVSEETGNTTLTMWVCDLISMSWEKLVAFDIGYKSEFIPAWSLRGFLENYLEDHAGSVRNVSIANIRGRDHQTKKWVAAERMSFSVNTMRLPLNWSEQHMGSYDFGADDSTFWIITSGVEGLCTPPDSGSVFSVKHATTDSPY